ncbi:SufE family protein [Entomomonas asaccharolytica]|uniref:SufE family protein n=1 Tax=Entomomonas asaccharolytica TaxID=2785331 RepID=A0A974RWU8_9GAMM|nr:SufE family protein [Entomomonas asaccharolytica]QQP85581.1 SufE family protein [Entomomonas asaccharolytica]
MSLSNTAQQILDTFTAANSWEQKMRLLMQVGATLQPLDEKEQIDKNQVQGCESLVWLIAEQHNQLWHFKAYSDARLMRGLLVVLIVRVNGLTADEIKQIDLEDWFLQLGLARQLSSSRRDGLKAIFQKIKSI